MSFFGAEWQETARLFSFKNNELVTNGLLTRTQSEQLSRMTHNSDAVISTNPNFLPMLASATSMHLVIRGTLPEDYFENLEFSLGARFAVSRQRDYNFVRQKPIARNIAINFSRITGIPIPELLVLLEEIPPHESIQKDSIENYCRI